MVLNSTFTGAEVMHQALADKDKTMMILMTACRWVGIHADTDLNVLFNEMHVLHRVAIYDMMSQISGHSLHHRPLWT